MADYYERNGFTADEFMEYVLGFFEDEPNGKSLWLGLATKYPLRAGNKQDNDWHEEAFKYANYLHKWKYGRFFDEQGD